MKPLRQRIQQSSNTWIYKRTSIVMIRFSEQFPKPNLSSELFVSELWYQLEKCIFMLNVFKSDNWKTFLILTINYSIVILNTLTELKTFYNTYTNFIVRCKNIFKMFSFVECPDFDVKCQWKKKKVFQFRHQSWWEL